jgi:pilus assembly protein CpaB
LSQSAGTLNPSRGNRRFIVLALVLGLMGAGLVYLATSRDTASTIPSTAAIQPVPVVVAKVEVPARTRITQEMLDVKLLPPEAVSPGAFSNVQTAVGQVTRYPLTIGEQVLTNKVVNVNRGISRSLSFVIPEGKRGFAITATEVQNAGGLLLPGDYVDIMLLQDVPFGLETAPAFLVQTLMQNVEVLAVAQAIVDVVEVPAAIQRPADGEAAAPASPVESEAAEGSTQRVRNTEAAPSPGASTITVAVTPEEAELLYLAEANGRIRLAVRPFGDDEVLDIDFQTKNELFPANIPNPFLQ